MSIRKRSAIHKAVLGGLLLSSLLELSSAQAAEVCVNSAALLQSTLTLAQYQPEPLHLKLAQGTYLMSSSFDIQLAGRTTIEGGYTAGCASRTPNPDNTVINIGQGNNWFILQKAGSPEALIDIDGITFTNANKGLTFSAGFYNYLGANDQGLLRITRSRFTQITSGGDSDPIRFLAENNRIELENVLFDHVSPGGSPDACSVKIFGPSGGSVLMNHVSADLTGGGNICFAESAGGDPTQYDVYNSILRSYALGGGHLVGTPAPGSVLNLVNNIMFFSGVNATTHETNQLSQNPGWIDGANGDYHLTTAPLSAAINSGSYTPPGGEPTTDIAGNPRIQGSFPDRGAYESSYNDATTLTVTNTQDSGGGSLRQAILDANSSPAIAKQIKFDIRGPSNVPTCPATIVLNTALPAIAAPMTIDGYTQPLSTKNTDADAVNANLCVSIKPAAGSLPFGFKVAADAPSTVNFRLRGVGLGGFAQPVMLLGGSDHVIAGNQFGGTTLSGVNLPGASLNAIAIGLNAGGTLIVGGYNIIERNVIVDADSSGINIQSNVVTSPYRCQIVNNLIGLKPDGNTALANFTGIIAAGEGCSIVSNRIAGNSSAQVLINGNKNVVTQNQIGIRVDGQGFANSATGVLVRGSGNVIGARFSGGSGTANTIRFNQNGGVVIQGDIAASGNSVNANVIYDNGPSGQAMDIDVQATGTPTGPTPNDPGDADTGPNFLQNFPIVKQLVYTDNGAGVTNRPAILGGMIDSLPGNYRVDAWYSSTINPTGKRGHAQMHLGRTAVTIGSAGGLQGFVVSVAIPSQIATGGISFTATDSVGNTSEVGTALSVDTIFSDGVD